MYNLFDDFDLDIQKIGAESVVGLAQTAGCATDFSWTCPPQTNQHTCPPSCRPSCGTGCPPGQACHN